MTNRDRIVELIDALEATLTYRVPNKDQLNEVGYGVYQMIIQARSALLVHDAMRRDD